MPLQVCNNNRKNHTNPFLRKEHFPSTTCIILLYTAKAVNWSVVRTKKIILLQPLFRPYFKTKEYTCGSISHTQTKTDPKQLSNKQKKRWTSTQSYFYLFCLSWSQSNSCSKTRLGNWIFLLHLLTLYRLSATSISSSTLSSEHSSPSLNH